jgi:hypothetical protein
VSIFSNVSKKVILSGVCVALMLSAVGLNLWYTRYRVPEAVSLEVEHLSKSFVHPPALVIDLPVPPSLKHIDIDSIRRQVARDEAAALTRVSRSRQNVTRTFIVGWGRHHGLFLVPLNSTSAKDWFLVDWIWPDFRDDAFAREFVQQAAPDDLTAAVHSGQRLICHCTGVPWRFGSGKRFLVRSATLEWQ